MRYPMPTLIPALLLALSASLTAPRASAQSPDLAIEPELLIAPSALPGASAGTGDVAALNQARQALLPRLQKALARIDAKVAALKASNLSYRFFIPVDRTRASQELLQLAAGLDSAEAQALARCLRAEKPLAFEDYPKDHTACRDEAAEAWSSAEVQKDPRLTTLLEALVFRTRDELSKLQAYERELTISRLAYSAEVRQFGDRTANLEFEMLGQDPAFQCNPALGTVRLDEPSTIAGQSIPTSMKDVAVQDQGPLGTCYANAASVALETITAKPNSALDLAIRYSMGMTRGDREISADFGGSFCGAIAIANRDGLCERQDSWIEATLLSGGNNKAAASLALQALQRFIGRRSAVPRSDWAVLEAIAPTLIPQILKMTEGRPITAIESPMTRNMASMIMGWVSLRGLPRPTAEAAIRAIRGYDYTHADEYLPSGRAYYANREQAASALYNAHAPAMIEVAANALPQVGRSYLLTQAQAYLRSGFQQMAANYYLDQLRSSLEVHRSIQAALQAQTQACSSPEMVEQVLLEVLSLADLSRKASPESAIDAVWLSQRLFTTRVTNVNEALLDTVAPRCQVRANRATIAPVSCQEHRPRDVKFVEGKLLQNLRHGRPLAISYCAEVLGHVSGPVAQRGRCGGHESLLTGIRYNAQTGRCDVQIWNSWGKATGKTWIETQRLLPFLMGLQELSLAPASLDSGATNR